MSSPEDRANKLSQQCLAAHKYYNEENYREALKEYSDIRSQLTEEELADNWLIIKQLGLCHYSLNHCKEAYKVWMSLEQNPLELFVFVTEKLQSESPLLLPELMDLFPKFRFLFYIAADRFLKIEKIEQLHERINTCPHPFDQWMLGGIQSLFLTRDGEDVEYLDRWRGLLDKMVQYTFHDFQTQRDLMEMCFTTLFHFHPSYLADFTVIDAQNWSSVVRKIYPSIDYVSSHAVKPQSSIGTLNRKIKIGFVNCFANRLHSVTRDRAGIIIEMNPERFDKHLVYMDSEVQDLPLVNNLMKSIPEENHHRIVPERFLFQPQQVLESLDQCQFDILVFCELGMNPISYLLAHARLAPIQVTTWGHSITSGISTIDYYFSSKWFESAANAHYYSEKLLLMNSLSTYYPTITPPQKDDEWIDIRTVLNIPTNGKIISCIQSYFKLQPEWFQCVKKILERGEGDFYLLLQIPKSSESEGGNTFEKKYRTRLLEIFGDQLSNIRFLETMDYRSYLQILTQADIMIDPFPFGGCNTSLEAFRLGKIVVTYPGPKLPGRFTVGFYHKMDILDPVCRDVDEYIEKTCYYLTNLEARQKIETRITESHSCLFLERESISEWEQVVESLVLYREWNGPESNNSRISMDIREKNHVKTESVESVESFESIDNSPTALMAEDQQHPNSKSDQSSIQNKSIQDEAIKNEKIQNEAIQKLNQSIASMNKELEQFKNENQNLKTQISEINNSFQSKQDKIDKLELEIETLKNRNKIMKKALRQHKISY